MKGIAHGGEFNRTIGRFAINASGGMGLSCGEQKHFAAGAGSGCTLGLMQLEPIKLGLGRSDWSRSPVLGARGSTARDFADLVAGQLVGTVLPWSQREALIEAALAQGINRFEANLIIAAVQHQMGVGKRRSDEKKAPLYRRIALGLGVFLVVQAGIVAAAWHWFF